MAEITVDTVLRMIEKASENDNASLKEIDALVEAYKLGATYDFKTYVQTGSYAPDMLNFVAYIDKATSYSWLDAPPHRYTLSLDEQESWLGPRGWKPCIALHSDKDGDYYVTSMCKDKTCICYASPDPMHNGIKLPTLHARVQALAYEIGDIKR